MKSGTLNWLLGLSSILMIWGPPALRAQGRELDAALSNPLSLDVAGAVQVGAWVMPAGLAAYLLVAHVERRTTLVDTVLADHPIRWYLFFGLLGVVSATWSPSPLYTAFFAVKILVSLFLLSALVWHQGLHAYRRPLDLLFLVAILQSLAIAIIFQFDPTLVSATVSDGFRLHGGMFADYGSSPLLAGLLFLTLWFFGRTTRAQVSGAVGYAASCIMLVLSQTRSAMAAGGLFVVIMAWPHPKLRRWVPLLALLAVVGILVVAPQFWSEAVGTATRDGEGVTTLSGRTVAFAYLMDHWRESPWVGNGFAAGTRDALVGFVSRTTLQMGSGHDAVSTVLVDLGLVGAAVLSGALISAGRRWVLLRRRIRTRQHNEEVIALYQVACLIAWVILKAVVDRSLSAPFMPFVVALVTMAWMWRLPEEPQPLREPAHRYVASPGRSAWSAAS